MVAWVLNPKGKKSKRSKARRARRSPCKASITRALNAVRASRKRRRKISAREREVGKASRRGLEAAMRSFGMSTNPGMGCCNVPVMANPGGVAGKLKAGFNVNSIKFAGIMAVGGLANNYVSDWVSRKIPGTWNTGLKGAVVGAATAGGLGAIAGMARPKLAAPIFTGALVQVMVKLMTPLFEKAVSALPSVAVTSVTPAPVTQQQLPAPVVTQSGYEDDDFNYTGMGEIDETADLSNF